MHAACVLRLHCIRGAVYKHVKSFTIAGTPEKCAQTRVEACAQACIQACTKMRMEACCRDMYTGMQSLENGRQP